MQGTSRGVHPQPGGHSRTNLAMAENSSQSHNLWVCQSNQGEVTIVETNQPGKARGDLPGVARPNGEHRHHPTEPEPAQSKGQRGQRLLINKMQIIDR